MRVLGCNHRAFARAMRGGPGQHGRKRPRGHRGLAGRRAASPAPPSRGPPPRILRPVLRAPASASRARWPSSTRSIPSTRGAPSAGATTASRRTPSSNTARPRGQSAAAWQQSPLYQLITGGGDEFAAGLDRPGPPDSRSRRAAARGADRLPGAGPPLRRRGRHRRDGLRLLLLDHGRTRLPRTGRPRGARRARSRPRPGGEVRLAGAHRGHAGRDLPRPRRGTARPGRPHRPRRGRTDQAVLWFSDLRGFTAITDNAPPEQVIPLLNDYAEAVISAVHEAGGEVLKLIGDGALAIFRADDPARGVPVRAAAEAPAASGSRR